jgi:hypothetical protein
MKELPTPILKFNGGNPVALCNKCSVIMCYVSCREQDGKYGFILRHNPNNNNGFYSTKPIGQTPPLYCDECEALINSAINVKK